jgi:DNA polymerase-1
MNQKKRLLIIDTNALIHRAYHALPPLRNKKGELINAVYGFCLVFLKVLKELKPDFIVAAFDLPLPTFRHKKFKGYKAKRPKTPEELSQQIPKVKELLKAFNIPVFEKEGFEADDIIGTIARLAPEKQVLPKGEEDKSSSPPCAVARVVENIILSGDADLFQLVDPDTKVYFLKKGIKNTILYDEELVKEKYQGLNPGELVNFKALKGDPSDNIPGVPGIGEKTAMRLIKKFGSLENLYSALISGRKISALNQRLRALLEEHKKEAFLSRDLIRIKKDVPIDFNLEKCRWSKYSKENATKILKDLEFNSLIVRLPEILTHQSFLKSENLKLF